MHGRPCRCMVKGSSFFVYVRLIYATFKFFLSLFILKFIKKKHSTFQPFANIDPKHIGNETYLHTDQEKGFKCCTLSHDWSYSRCVQLPSGKYKWKNILKCNIVCNFTSAININCLKICLFENKFVYSITSWVLMTVCKERIPRYMS